MCIWIIQILSSFILENWIYRKLPKKGEKLDIDAVKGSRSILKLSYKVLHSSNKLIFAKICVDLPGQDIPFLLDVDQGGCKL